MPRHLRASGEVPTMVTIPVGSSVHDARRQLALKTLASTGGDVARTAKLLGTSPDDVRRDVMALLSDAGAAETSGDENTNGKHPPGDISPAAKPTAPAKKPLPKKR
jgi:methylmalonyl-CoA mutase cobalamin-binding subunit